MNPLLCSSVTNAFSVAVQQTIIRPNDCMTCSILNLLFCNLLFGAIAVTFSCLAQSAFNRGEKLACICFDIYSLNQFTSFNHFYEEPSSSNVKFDAVCADSTGKTIGAVELHIFNGFSVSDSNGGSREITESFLAAVFFVPSCY